ncbi:hypothetical protein PAMP_006723 [Pampus punctatissimus]
MEVSWTSCSQLLLVERTRMALRKQINKDVPSESQKMDEDTQEDEDLDDEMTEEEMMDLALRLSEQEANVTALRLQQEEEAMIQAIQESMVSQTQPRPSSQSQSLLPEAEASFRLCSRRKLMYSNGKTASTSEKRSGSGDANNNMSKKRKRKEGSPLLEMPDLSQTQKICSESASMHLDSPQSCDSTQIDDCQLRKSPVFPSTVCRAEVQIPRLSQNLLETCRTSGFVLCSQDSSILTQMCPSAQQKSPTFPKSPTNTAHPKSPVFSETDQGDDGDVELSPEYLKSPVFGSNTQHERSTSACKPISENSGFMFSSSVRSTSCRPRSPVFSKSPALPKNATTSERSAFPKSPLPSETKRDGRSTSPVFCGTERRQNVHADVQKSVMSSAAELQGSSSDESSPMASRLCSRRDPPLCLRPDRTKDRDKDSSRFNSCTMSLESDDADKLNEPSKDWNSGSETELTSNMMLRWSDVDEDVTPVGSPSPVFPEERLVHEADDPAASLNRVTAASPGTNGPNCSLNPHRSADAFTEDQSSSNKRTSLQPSTSSTSTCRQPVGSQPVGSQPVGSASARPGEPAAGPMVHYYWGVPFCPRGLDPDSYTQVILAQMEVYEKSLKRAQRSLLRKAEWGEAILPQPEKSPSPESPAESPQQLVPRRRGLRLRRLSDAADTPPAETEEDEDMKKEEEEEEERGKRKEEDRNKSGGEEGHVDTDDCEVCPETQLSNDDITQDLLIATDDRAELQHKSPETILRVDSPAGDEPQDEEEEEEVEVDAPVDAEMERNDRQNVTEEEDRVGPDAEEIQRQDRRLQRSNSPELEPPVTQSTKTDVDCPICQGSFPATEIEMHAAYCDGEVAVVDERKPEDDCFQVSLKPRRKRTRRAADEPTDPSNTGRNQEKCFICQKAVPLRDYNQHTELCIQQQASKSAAKGNLLSALQQTESKASEAGPSGSRLQPADVIDLRDDDEEEDRGTGSRFRISNSPIRSFTPISEATDCLIDFKKRQGAKKPSQRRR